MSGAEWVGIIGAVAAGVVAIVGALGVVYSQLRSTHELVNSRMTELLAVTKESALAQGRLAGPGVHSEDATERPEV